MPNADHVQLLEVHLAEYNALTTRLTYWIYIQYVVYGIAGTALGLILAFVPESVRPYQGWLFLFILLATGWAILLTQDEIITTALYIEGCLKPAVKHVLDPLEQVDQSASPNTVWNWEHFRRERQKPDFLSTNLTRGLRRAIPRLVGFEEQWGVLIPGSIGMIAAIGLILVRLRESEHDTKLAPYMGRIHFLTALWLAACLYLLTMVCSKTIYNSALREKLNRLVETRNAKSLSGSSPPSPAKWYDRFSGAGPAQRSSVNPARSGRKQR